jgi:hypothetical protein
MAATGRRAHHAGMSAAWRLWAPYLLVPLGHFAGAKFGVLCTAMPEGTAILWPPNSVLLAALVLRQGQGALALALLVVAVDLPAFSLPEALLFGLVNVAEAWIGFALLRRCGFDAGFGTLRDFNRFLLAAPLAAALCGAVGGCRRVQRVPRRGGGLPGVPARVVVRRRAGGAAASGVLPAPLHELLRQAHQALYAAKAQGRDRAVVAGRAEPA